MKRVLLLGVALAAWAPHAPTAQSAEGVDVMVLASLCASETAGAAIAALPSAPPPLSERFGNAAFQIDSEAPAAKRWFDYGFQLAWAFAHEDAKAAFAEAVRLDPDCAACAWGHAWSLGPTINYPLDPAQRSAAHAAAVKAHDLAVRRGSERDRLVSAGLVKRYAGQGGDRAWAKALQALPPKLRADDATQVLIADALMVAERPADAIPILEAVLKRAPRDAAAIHFYIHATEWVGAPGKAEAYADTLGQVAPGASHLIHMPSHTYYQVGRYKDAGRVNVEAMAVDGAWLKAKGQTSEDLLAVPYYGHNIRFALGGAMMAGDGEAALMIAERYGKLARAAKDPANKTGAGAAWLALGRFGEVDTVLAMPAPEGEGLQTTLWRYGRGEALARKGDAPGVRAEAAAIAAVRKGLKRAEFADPVTLSEIAEQVLLGRAAMIARDYRAAEKHFARAAARQERVLAEFRDPPPWWYPVRRSQAAALLAQGKAEAALAQTATVLARWPHDPLTLSIAARAQSALGRDADAGRSAVAARREWASGDPSSVTLPLI